MAAMAADDAKGIMANHAGRYHKSKGSRGSTGGASTGGGGGGLLTPLIGDLGGGDSDDYNSNPIRLQAK